MQILCALLSWLIDPDNLTAVSTVVVAAFTGVLAVVSICQGRLIRRDFIATHRPRVVVRYIGSPNHGGGYQSVSVTLANIGSSKAVIREWGCDLARWNAADEQIDRGSGDPQKIAPIVLVSGDRHSFPVVAKIPHGDREIFEDAMGDMKKLRVFGIVRYADENEILRETGFFRIYDEASKSFVPSEHKDREYQD